MPVNKSSNIQIHEHDALYLLISLSNIQIHEHDALYPLISLSNIQIHEHDALYPLISQVIYRYMNMMLYTR